MIIMMTSFDPLLYKVDSTVSIVLNDKVSLC